MRSPEWGSARWVEGGCGAQGATGRPTAGCLFRHSYKSYSLGLRRDPRAGDRATLRWEGALGRAAFHGLGERAIRSQGFNAWRETAPISHHQGGSAAMSRADRASTARGRDLSAFGKATGRAQGPCRVRQDLLGRGLAATFGGTIGCRRPISAILAPSSSMLPRSCRCRWPTTTSVMAIVCGLPSSVFIERPGTPFRSLMQCFATFGLPMATGRTERAGTRYHSGVGPPRAVIIP